MRPRRAHLGERIRAVEHLRAGRATVAEVAAFYRISLAEVDEWLRVHAGDRTLHLAQIRGELAGEPGRLAQQALYLRRLISRADRTLRDLHAQLLFRKLATPLRGLPTPIP
jgi:hypothetical protein